MSRTLKWISKLNWVVYCLAVVSASPLLIVANAYNLLWLQILMSLLIFSVVMIVIVVGFNVLGKAEEKSE